MHYPASCNQLDDEDGERRTARRSCKGAATVQKLGGPNRAKPESRARSARDLRAKPESRAKPEKKRGEGSGEGAR